jgi:hypothetical protein
MSLAACGGDDGVTPPPQPQPDGGSSVGPQGPCNGAKVNECGGCAVLTEKVGNVCGAGQFTVCKGSDATECKAGDGPPATGLSATTDLQDRVVLSWTAPTVRTPVGYVIARDGVELGAAAVARYEDRAAEAPTLTAPSAVQASDGTFTDKVTVTWTPGAATPGKSHKYTVTPVYTQAGATLKGLASNEATGNRASTPITGYEVQRDDGTWVPAGTGSTYDDKDAPLSKLVGGDLETVAVSRGPSVIAFGVNINGTPIFTDATPAAYKVRAVTASGPLPAGPSDTGFRKKPVFSTANSSVKWQRSSKDGDFGYSDLPGQTFTRGLDMAGPSDGSGRFYRAVVKFDGAEFNSPAQRATAATFKSAQLFWDTGCGVRSDDSVACWGSNNGNMVQGIPAGLKAKKVVVGSSHACAIKLDDTGVCWGNTGGGLGTVPSGAIKDIAASEGSACFVKSDDTLACAGGVAAPPGGTFKRVYRGTSNTFCATKSDDTTACWGNNNSNIVSGAPLTVKFKTIAGGDSHFCGITDADKLLCWGANDTSPFLTSRTPFVGTPSVDTYKAISVGWDNTCATRSDDTLECWGRGEEGHFVGRSTLKFKSLAHGNRMACGIDAGDRFVCAPSRNFNGPGPDEVAPQLPLAGAKFAGNVGREGRPCVILQDGSAQCFGNGNLDTQGSSRAVNPASRFKVVESGNGFGCGIKTDDTLECWGGGGSTAPRTTVAKYISLSVEQSGSRVACAVRQDNVMECYGTTALAGAFKQVAIGQHQVCGIKTDDTIACTTARYRNRGYGLPAAPSGTFKSISGGTRRGRGGFCAVGTDNKVVCWGNSITGSDDPNQTYSAAVNAVVGGSSGFCGLTTDGRRRCNNSTAYGTGLSLETFDSIAQIRDTGFCHVRSDKLFYCDGNNTQPQMPRFY